jgi:hypothetical protein
LGLARFTFAIVLLVFFCVVWNQPILRLYFFFLLLEPCENLLGVQPPS